MVPVTEEEVVWCYRSILERNPESTEVVRDLAGTAQDFRSLVKIFLDSHEHRTRNSRAALVPLARGEMEIELAASPAELAQLIDRIREAWTHLGKVRPHHSVLTGDAYLPEALDEAAIERFYDSGKQELSSMIEAILERHGFAGLESKTCVEYGCGLGRVTLALASKCAAVHGYDISPNHLALAEKRAAETGAGNVRFHLCTADVIGKPLEPCDFFFSCIVFQHNPPPIMLAMLSASGSAGAAQGSQVADPPRWRHRDLSAADLWHRLFVSNPGLSRGAKEPGDRDALPAARGCLLIDCP